MALAAGVGLVMLSGCQLGFDPRGMSLLSQHTVTAPPGGWGGGPPDLGGDISHDHDPKQQQKPIPVPIPVPIPKPKPKPIPVPVPKPKPKSEIVPGSTGREGDSLPAAMARQDEPDPWGGSHGGPPHGGDPGPTPVQPQPPFGGGGNGDGGSGGNGGGSNGDGSSNGGGGGGWLTGNPRPSAPSSSRGLTPSPERAAIGDTCSTDREGHLCLALKYVVYRDSSGEPIESVSEVAETLERVNRIWGDCGIAFRIDEAQAIRPEDYGLRYNTANYQELGEIRQALSDDTSLLVAVTGDWDRRGSLGGNWANAWTNLPGGGGLFGTVLERPVEHNPNVIAHELGHYLSLDHVSDPANVMSPMVGFAPMGLERTQCRAARAAVREFWLKMLR